MAETSPAPPASARLRRLFLSPIDGRLRGGWRLLAHGAAFGVLLLVLSLPAGALAVLVTFLAPHIRLETLASVLGALASAAAISLATWFCRRFLDRRSWLSLGLGLNRRALLDLLIGFLIPGLLMGAVFAVERGLGWLQFEGWGWEADGWGATLGALAVGLVLFSAVGYEEELLSRGYQLQNLVESTNLPIGLFLSAAIFSILHLSNPGAGWGSLLGILAAGYFLAYGWVRTRRLWLSIGLHIGWNFFEGPVFGFPVSGLPMTPLIHQTVSGPTWATGGVFGPEAGLVILPAMAAGALLIWLYTRGRGSGSPTKRV